MKHIGKIFLACAFLSLLMGCEKKEDLATAFAPEDVVAPVLSYTGGDVVVTADNQNETVTFTWTPADFGVATSIQYLLYIKVGGGSPVLLKSTTGKSVEVPRSDLSIAVLRAGGMAGEPSDVAACVSAEIGSNYYTTLSQDVTFKVTPFEVVPAPLFLVGSALVSEGDSRWWNNANYTFIMFRDENLSEDEVMVTKFLAGGEFQLLPNLGSWDGQIGGASGKLDKENHPNISLDGSSGYLTLTANTGNLTYAITPYDATGKTVYTAVALGSTPLTKTTYDEHMWTAEDVKLTAGASEYFTADGTQFGAAGFPYGKATAGGDAIRVKAGNYFVKFSDLTGHYVFYETVDLSSVTPPVLETPATSSIAVTADNRGDKITFSWTAAVFPVAGDVTYTLYARIGNDGTASAVDGSATAATQCEVTYGALNNAALAAGATAGTAADVQFFVEAVVGVAKSASESVVINITPVEFTYPAAVYMIGQDFGGWDWSSTSVVEMTPVHSHEGQFWCVRYFTANNGFKWSSTKAWSGDFSSLGTDVGFTVSGGNAQVATDGFYSVYIDYTTNTITIEQAQVYGMGDCFGGWNTGQYPFTVSGQTMQITTTAASNLRMYATSSAAQGLDWWQMEFNVFSGNIEYRGTGGDQSAVPATVGQVVTLDFNAGTGTIQ